MKTQLKNKIVTVIFAGFILLSFLLCLIKPVTEYSSSERRNLAKFPKLTWQTILDKDFQEDFTKYASDQFPFRDELRTIKALFQTKLLGFLESNGLAIKDGYIAKIENFTNDKSIENAVNKFSSIYDKHFKDTDAKVYLSIVPDKGYFMAEDGFYPSLDYEKIEADMIAGLGGMEYIDLFNVLELEDFYKTDTHWTQEKLGDTVKALTEAMGSYDRLTGEYTVNKLSPFYGVYYGQAALPLPSEDLNYLTSDILDACTVYDYLSGKTFPLYRTELFAESEESKDGYNVFMGGASALPLLRIDNPNATTDKELIIFRDSFGSSIAPLLAEGYSSVYLVDIRYGNFDMMKEFYKLEITDQDVLFLYSSIILNSSFSFK